MKEVGLLLFMMVIDGRVWLTTIGHGELGTKRAWWRLKRKCWGPICFWNWADIVEDELLRLVVLHHLPACIMLIPSILPKQFYLQPDAHRPLTLLDLTAYGMAICVYCCFMAYPYGHVHPYQLLQKYCYDAAAVNNHGLCIFFVLLLSVLKRHAAGLLTPPSSSHYVPNLQKNVFFFLCLKCAC